MTRPPSAPPALLHRQNVAQCRPHPSLLTASRLRHGSFLLRWQESQRRVWQFHRRLGNLLQQVPRSQTFHRALAPSAARLAAIDQLSQRRTPEIRNRLASLVEQGSDGTFSEPDAAVREAATRALSRIDRARAIYSGIETLFFGLSLGSVLVLVAIGLAITFGVMGVINMAHGELMMLGAYTTYVVQLAMPQSIGLSVLIAIPAAFVVA